eukprot:GCRY01004008.1.p1 GENE.GCRY01004008.1~~GCRY01004008.1.p1  ORF type:complete len:1016 (+),score=234.23 GCRY01004008.1:232-3279(+)
MDKPERGTKLRALYSYTPNDPASQIPLVQGEILELIECYDGWWSGTNSVGKVGYFPATYVEIVQESTDLNDEVFQNSPGIAEGALNGADDGSDTTDSEEEESNTIPTAVVEPESHSFTSGPIDYVTTQSVCQHTIDHLDWATFEALKDAHFTKAEKKSTESWSKLDIPLRADEAIPKLKTTIRKGVPDPYRRKCYRAVTGAQELLMNNPLLYDEALTKTFGAGDRIPTDVEELSNFGGKLPEKIFKYMDRLAPSVYRRLLKVVAAFHEDIKIAPMIPSAAALLLMYMPETECFYTIESMIRTSRADDWFFTLEPTGREIFAHTFFMMIETRMSDVAKALTVLHVDPMELCERWFDKLFLDSLPLLTVLRIFDVYLAEGTKILYRIGMALLKINDKVIKKSRSKVELMEGLDVWTREKGSDADNILKTALGFSFSRKDTIKLSRTARSMSLLRTSSMEADEASRPSLDRPQDTKPHEKRKINISLVFEETFMLDPTQPINAQLPELLRRFKFMLKNPRLCDTFWLENTTTDPFQLAVEPLQPHQSLASQQSLEQSAPPSTDVNLNSNNGTTPSPPASPAAPQSTLLLKNKKYALEEDDVDDIWEEIQSGNVGNVIANGDQVKAGTLNMLIERLTSPKTLDLAYMRAFLTTLHSFTTPSVFLSKLMQRYNVPFQEDLSEEQFAKEVQRPIQLRVFNVLKVWISEFYEDFDDALLTKLNNFIEEVIVGDGHLQFATQLRKALAKGVDINRKVKHMFSEPPPKPILPKISAQRLKLEDIDVVEIARQMTLAEFDLYTAIKASELVNLAWEKPSERFRCPNVLRMIERFNEVQGWCVRKILETKKIKDRVSVMNRFILLAQQLEGLKNFNTCMAIIAGLNKKSILRLHHTRADLPKQSQKVLEDLEHVMSPKDRYRTYRELLHNINPPCIPYLGVYLSDLHHVENEHSDMLGNLINMTKKMEVYKVFTELTQFQQQPFNLQEEKLVYELARSFPPPLPEEDQIRLSYALEPNNVQRAKID